MLMHHETEGLGVDKVGVRAVSTNMGLTWTIVGPAYTVQARTPLGERSLGDSWLCVPTPWVRVMVRL